MEESLETKPFREQLGIFSPEKRLIADMTTMFRGDIIAMICKYVNIRT